MGACRHEKGGSTCPLEMLKNVLLLQMLSETSVDELFMHHFEKMSSATDYYSTGELTLDPAGGLPSFIPPHCPPLEKNPAGAHVQGWGGAKIRNLARIFHTSGL